MASWCPNCGHTLGNDASLQAVSGWFFERQERMTAIYRIHVKQLELAVCLNCGFQEAIDFRSHCLRPALAVALPVALN